MAETPEQIEDVVQTKNTNAAGIYELKFYVNGHLTSVLVDEYLPVMKGTKKLAFAQTKSESLWVSLLEKGWAKLHGSYSSTSGGVPSFATSHLLGVPLKTLRHADCKNMNNFWNVLLRAEQRKFKMFSTSLSQGEEENQ